MKCFLETRENIHNTCIPESAIIKTSRIYLFSVDGSTTMLIIPQLYVYNYYERDKILLNLYTYILQYQQLLLGEISYSLYFVTDNIITIMQCDRDFNWFDIS